MEKMLKYYNDMSDFVDDTGKAVKTWSDTLSGRGTGSEDPDEYLPRRNLKQIELILINDKKLAKQLVKMGEQLRNIKTDEQKKELIVAYSDVLEKVFA